MSSREKNRAKRKARQAIGKQRSRDVNEETITANGEEPDKKKIKFEDYKVKEDNTMILGKSADFIMCKFL